MSCCSACSASAAAAVAAAAAVGTAGAGKGEVSKAYCTQTYSFPDTSFLQRYLLLKTAAC
jgi:hypothetical protein